MVIPPRARLCSSTVPKRAGRCAYLSGWCASISTSSIPPGLSTRETCLATTPMPAAVHHVTELALSNISSNVDCLWLFVQVEASVPESEENKAKLLDLTCYQ